MYEEFDEAFKKRLEKANKVVLEAYEKLDPNSPTYNDDLEAVTKLTEVVTKDYKNYADIDAEKLRSLYEQEKARNEVIDSIFRALLGFAGIFGSIGVFITDMKNRNARIDKVAKFEDDNAILKTADRIAVSDALKEDRKPFSFPFFGK